MALGNGSVPMSGVDSHGAIDDSVRGGRAVVLLLRPPIILLSITFWLVKILSAVVMLYFVIDLFKHIASSPRDLGAAGKDALILVVLLAIAAKADVLVKWAQSAL